MVEIEPLTARRIAVLADCHVHPGGGPDWTPQVLAALDGVEAILTLGDMGEGLERLGRIAPVLGVAGMDDAPDPRAAPTLRAFEIGGKVVGLLFDPVAAGLAATSAPFATYESWRERIQTLFGRQLDVLLHASTHKASMSLIDGVLVVDPGSALLPAGQESGAPGAYAEIWITDNGLSAFIVEI